LVSVQIKTPFHHQTDSLFWKPYIYDNWG